MQAVIDVCGAKAAEAVGGEARRLFHGRGHFYPDFEHVVVNWFPPYLQIAWYAQPDTAQIELLVAGLLRTVPDVAGIVVQLRDGRATRTTTWYGEVPDEHIIYESGLKYWIQPKRNQNVGLFMDMAHVRQKLAPTMRGARVLNLFAYTCAFSVAAIANGATHVLNNDMNANMLKVGTRNHVENDHDLRCVTMLAQNLFKVWKRVRSRGPYDLIIVDPPTNQRGSFTAQKHYPQVLKQISKLAAPGTRVVACLNSPFLGYDFLENVVARWAPGWRLQEMMPVHPDFPEAFPERGLKVLEYICH